VLWPKVRNLTIKISWLSDRRASRPVLLTLIGCGGVLGALLGGALVWLLFTQAPALIASRAPTPTATPTSAPAAATNENCRDRLRVTECSSLGVNPIVIALSAARQPIIRKLDYNHN
jgi:hypothetical protein